MTEKSKKVSLPYSTYPAFINFINKLRESGVPNRIDATTFGNASGSLVYSVLASLKALKLISEDGDPTQRFVNFVNAPDDQRSQLLREIVMQGYPSLFREGFDLTNITAGQFDEHIREEFDVAGSTIDKIASFFLAAAKAAEIPVSKFLEMRSPIASSPSSKKSSKQRKKTDNGDAGEGKPYTQPVISEKALEYRLVDLMTEAAGSPDVLQSIVNVITFLKIKDAEPPKIKSTETLDGDN